MSISIDLTGRRALVTGAGRGIGKGVALRLAEAGADVAVNDLDPTTAEATAEAVRALGRRSVAIPADISTRPAVEAVADAAEAALGGVDILVNNAGISLYRKEVYRKRLILERFETPDDIAKGVLFLCSPLGDQVTGSHLIVSGGLPFHA